MDGGEQGGQGGQRLDGDAVAAGQEVEDLIQSLGVALEPPRPKSDSTIPLTLVQRSSGSAAFPTLLSKAGPCKVLSLREVARNLSGNLMRPVWAALSPAAGRDWPLPGPWRRSVRDPARPLAPGDPGTPLHARTWWLRFWAFPLTDWFCSRRVGMCILVCREAGCLPRLPEVKERVREP